MRFNLRAIRHSFIFKTILKNLPKYVKNFKESGEYYYKYFLKVSSL